MAGWSDRAHGGCFSLPEKMILVKSQVRALREGLNRSLQTHISAPGLVGGQPSQHLAASAG